MAPDAHSNPSAGRRHAIQALAAASFAALLSAVVLLRFPPDQYSFYPRCPILALTGFRCPGCGATRALAALLHLHFAEALHWNALVVLLLPLLAGYLAAAFRQLFRGRAWPQLPQSAIAVLLVLATIFTAIRDFA